MKVYAISDLHLSIFNPKPMNIFGEVWDNYIENIMASWNDLVADEDIVLLSGDLSWAMTMDKAILDINFIGDLKGKKIILRGNHDYWWKSISNLRSILPKDMYAIQNDCLKFDNILICGTRGWTTPEGKNQSADDKKIYDREVIRMRLSLESMTRLRKEGDIVIVMVHYPPFNSKLDNSPFVELFNEFKVDKVVYGHLHGKEGRVCKETTINNIKYYLTSCDIVENKLVEIV